MSEGGHMGIWHTWAVYRCAQVIYGAAIVERKGVNGGKSDSRSLLQSVDSLLQMIVLEKLLSTLAKEVLVEADPGMFPIQHDPEAVS